MAVCCNSTSRRWGSLWCHQRRSSVQCFRVIGVKQLLRDQHACGNKLRLVHQNTPTRLITHTEERWPNSGLTCGESRALSRHGSGELLNERVSEWSLVCQQTAPKHEQQRGFLYCLPPDSIEKSANLSCPCLQGSILTVWRVVSRFSALPGCIGQIGTNIINQEDVPVILHTVK